MSGLIICEFQENFGGAAANAKCFPNSRKRACEQTRTVKERSVRSNISAGRKFASYVCCDRSLIKRKGKDKEAETVSLSGLLWYNQKTQQSIGTTMDG